MRDERFHRLFESTHARLFRAARRKLPAETAQEVVADTFVTLWRKNVPDPLDAEEECMLQGLIFRILEGHVRNALRAESVRRRLQSGVEDRSMAASHSPIPPSRLDDLLPTLNEADRRVIELYVDGYRTGEIAAVLGCSVKAAGMRLVRARRSLRAAAEEVLVLESR